MLDQYGRIIDYMRISLTDRCNLRCIYCMPEEGICQIPRTEVLSEDEILRVCSLASELGISRIKLTGGEPLVRRICVPLVKELKALPGIQQVTLTTNGILLKEQLPGLMEAGLDAVNISLDTLDAETFRKMKLSLESAQNVEMTGMPEWIAEQQRELLRVQKNIAEISETMPLLQAQETYQKYWKATKSYEHMVKTSELIYNDSVENYNCMLHRIPDRIAAGICGYHRKKLIEIM